jgi:glycosyltransferase involved in cell wall biosynthesis
MKTNNFTLGILITTCNENIKRVKKDLVPNLIKNKNIDEIIISHQIFDKITKPEKNLTKGKVKYFYMFEKGLSKNRNNCLKNSKSDICHICDDDLIYLKDFSKIIKTEYLKNKNLDLITFQATKENNKNHFDVKQGKHNSLSILKIWSWGITFKRKSILNKNIKFDETFGLGSKWCVGEENIFLKDCLDKKLKMIHCDNSIVFHKDESSGLNYRDNLIISRIKVFKRLFGFVGGFLGIFYFTIFKYKEYKNKYSFFKYFWLSFKSLF